MIARMRNDCYIDLTPDYPYEIEKVWYDGHFRLKNSPRKYRASCFKFYHNDKEIPFKEVYRLYRIQCIKAKLGMK